MSSREALLVEYQIAQSDIERIDRQFWQAAQVFIPLSIAGLGYFATLEKHSVQTLTTMSIIGIGSSIIIWAWFRIIDRWWVYQAVLRYRMREIESELGLWSYRYGDYKAKLSRHQYPLETEDVSDEERQRYIILSEKVPLTPKGMPTLWYIRLMVFVVIFGWILLIAREAFLTLVP